MMLIVDAHEDLAWNMLTYGRDYTLPAAETRRREAGTDIPQQNDDTLLGWPEYQRGQVAVVFATLFAAPQRASAGSYETQVYAGERQARQLYSAQLDLYDRLADEHDDKFRLIQSRDDLQAVLDGWASESENHPVGLVMLMEGAEAVGSPGELEEWWQRGVRLIGPAWAGNRFCGGTNEPGPLTSEGIALLEGMASLGFVLDLSHMDQQAALQALDAYPGPITATHANAQALLKGYDGNRHLPDRVIRGLLERDGVIGVVPYNGFLQAGWRRGDRRDLVSLDRLVAHLDYICQMAGDASHAGLGTDFDGGFGVQSIPPGIDTIADLQKLGPLLAERGYSQEDIHAILGDNWLGLLQKNLPESV
jgi:membrane dipeptidase